MPTLAALKNPYVLPVAAQVVGGLLNRSAAGSATNALTSGVNDAMSTVKSGVANAETALTAGKDAASGTLKDLYGEQKSMLQPFVDTGTSSLDQIKKFVTPGDSLDALYQDPGFQFRLKQGQRAIDAAANAGGTRWSGATLKQIASFNQDQASQELNNSFNRLMQVEGIGQQATNTEVGAASQYGANLANLESGYGKNVADLETGLGQSLAGLQTDLASAKAAGDVAKANSISNTISGVLQSVDQIKTAKTLRDLLGLGKSAPAAVGSVADIVGSAGGGAALASTVPDIGASIAAAGGGAEAAIPAFEGPIAAGSTGGFLGTAGAFLTNPFTIAAGAALGIGALWAKSQAHHEASAYVKSFQDPFDASIAKIRQLPNLAPQDKQALEQSQVADYLHAAQNFKSKGSDEAKVVNQAMTTFKKYYPEYAAMLPQFGL